MNNYDIIFAPIITEKTAAMEAEGKYVFKVDVRANKTQIKQAIESAFDVKVEKINTLKKESSFKSWIFKILINKIENKN